MLNKLCIILFIVLINSQLFSLTDAEKETLYFEIEGIWESTKTYSENVFENRTERIDANWGTVEYNPNAAFLLDVYSDNPSIIGSKIKNIEFKNNEYILEVDLGYLKQDNKYYYLKSISPIRMMMLEKRLSITGRDTEYIKVTGPRRTEVTFKATVIASDARLHSLPYDEAKIVSKIDKNKIIDVSQMTLCPPLVDEYSPWVKASIDGKEGWINRSKIRPIW